MTVILETSRLLLREFTPADAALLVELDSDPEVMRFITDGEATSKTEIEEETIPRFLRYYRYYADFGYWAAVEKQTGEFIGWFHFRPSMDIESEIELGYRLKRSAWGKGYATEGSQALVDRGKAQGVQVIVARALLANKASIHVMEKVGLKFQQEFVEERFPGADQQAVKYSWSASD